MSSAKIEQLIRLSDNLNEKLGRGIAWATLLLVLLTFVIVVMRYLFQVGSVALQESLLYLHSLVFLAGAAYTLKHDGHVRVDIFYRPASPKRKAWINLLGTLLLLAPACIFILSISWDYVASSWSYYEGSREAGGIDAVYLLKSLLLVMPVLLLIQGATNVLRSILIIRGHLSINDESGEAGL